MGAVFDKDGIKIMISAREKGPTFCSTNMKRVKASIKPRDVCVCVSLAGRGTHAQRLDTLMVHHNNLRSPYITIHHEVEAGKEGSKTRWSGEKLTIYYGCLILLQSLPSLFT